MYFEKYTFGAPVGIRAWASRVHKSTKHGTQYQEADRADIITCKRTRHRCATLVPLTGCSGSSCGNRELHMHTYPASSLSMSSCQSLKTPMGERVTTKPSKTYSGGATIESRRQRRQGPPAERSLRVLQLCHLKRTSCFGPLQVLGGYKVEVLAPLACLLAGHERHRAFVSFRPEHLQKCDLLLYEAYFMCWET